MNLNFIFFQNPALLQEIRKHKWIESEKAGRDIGFATAAFDWMTKHYETWTKRHPMRSFAEEALALHR